MHLNCVNKKSLVLAYCYLICCFFTACQGSGSGEIESKDISREAIKAERNREDYNEAIVNFNRLLKREPDNIILLISLGNSYFDIGEDLKAIEHYKKALKLDPDNVPVRTDLGTAYRRTGRSDRALEEYRKSLAIDSRHSISRYNVGVVLLWDKKDVDGAIKVWEELLRIDPYFVMAEELKKNINILKDLKAEGKKR